MKLKKAQTQNITYKKDRYKKRDFELFFMISPVLIHILIFNYIPMFGVVLAFKKYNASLGIFKSQWVGLQNFKFFFKSEDAWRITRNTVGLNFMFIVIGIVCAVAMALMLFEIKNKRAIKIYQTTMILPHFFSWIIVSYMLFAFLNPRIGILNGFISTVFPEIVGYNLYSKPNAWPLILLFIYIWKHCGMDLIIYYAGLMAVNDEYFEAADLDGANKLQKIWYISIPTISPLIAITTILKLGGIFRADFGMFYSVPMNSGLLYATTDVIDTYVFRSLKDLGDVGMSAAVGLFQSIVGFVVINITNKAATIFEEDYALF